MAAPARYPTPHAQLLQLAVLARGRGLSFEAFWELAVRPELPAVTVGTPEERRPVGAAIWPRDTFGRTIARDATLDAKEGWRRAYLNAPPTRPERALRIIAPFITELERGNGRPPAVRSAA